jgi:hypothetical protein
MFQVAYDAALGFCCAAIAFFICVGVWLVREFVRVGRETKQLRAKLAELRGRGY